MAKLLNFFLIKIVEVIVLLYDMVTFVPYFLYQKPHKVLQTSRRLKAKPLMGKDTRSPFRSVESFSKLISIPQEGIHTIEDLFNFTISKHSKLPALGTRELLSEEEEMVEGGKLFKKAIFGDYKWETYEQVKERVMNVACGLRALTKSKSSFEAHQKKICLFAETRAEWMISIFACVKGRFPIVTIYASLGMDGVTHGVNETEVHTIIVSPDLLPKIKDAISSLTTLVNVVCMGQCQKEVLSLANERTVTIISMDDLEVLGVNNKAILAKESALKKDDIVFIMYTSGSTGVPKGVLISHGNILCAISGQSQRVGSIGPSDVFVGYLPLAHVLEIAAEICCFFKGVPIGYSSPSTLTDNSTRIKPGSKGDLAVLRPTLMTTVPLIADRLYKAVWEKVHEGSKFKLDLFTFAYEYKKKNYEAGYNTPLCDMLIFSKIRKILGGRIRLLLTGGAPLSSDTQRFMNICFCCPITQGYGLTETCGAGAVSEASDRSTGKVGAPLQCNDIMLVNWEEGKYYATDRPFPRGEVWISGGNVAMGYYNASEADKDSFKVINGQTWFATGDIGMIEPDGSLRIIDRRKDLIKLQAGEYIALAKVETQLKLCPLVDNLCVYANSNKMYTVCLIVPNRKNLEQLAFNIGVTIGWPYICDDPLVVAAVLKEVQMQGLKSKLEKFEIPQRLTMVPDIWTPDTGLVTPAFKLKRKNIESHYLADILRMYA